MVTDIKVIMERIRTILAMTESPNEAEAATATEMAHKMLKEHNLSLSDLDFKEQSIIEETYEEYQRMPPWKDQLLFQICWTNYCDGYRHSVYPGGHSHGGGRTDAEKKWIVVGRQENVATVKVMADYLITTIERLAKRYEGSTDAKKSYKQGIVVTLINRLRHMRAKERVETPETTALVIKESSLVDQHINNMENLKKEKSEGLTFKDLEAFLAGKEDGKGISLNTQIDSDGKSADEVLKMIGKKNA